ncbi:hypothetical protein I4U23_013981 [Adineta vaga]|nr:hypothetical protein I4U23_013981 [Adineta vaga]
MLLRNSIQSVGCVCKVTSLTTARNSNDTINNELKIFQTTRFLTDKILTEDVFLEHTNSIIQNFQLATELTYYQSFDLVQYSTRINQLISSLFSDYIMSLDIETLITSFNMRSYENNTCRCYLLKFCYDPLILKNRQTDGNLSSSSFTIPSLYTGCYLVEAIRHRHLNFNIILEHILIGGLIKILQISIPNLVKLSFKFYARCYHRNREIRSEKQGQALIDIFISSNENAFQNSLQINRDTIHANSLLSGFGTSFALLLNLDNLPTAAITRIPRITNESTITCSCYFDPTCVRSTALYNAPVRTPFFSIPGFYLGCYIVEGTLKSNLASLYNQTWINQFSSFISFNATTNVLDASWASQYNQTTPIETLMKKLMPEPYYTFINYSSYFEQCHSVECRYTYTKKYDLIYIITTLIGIVGGLITIYRYTRSSSSASASLTSSSPTSSLHNHINTTRSLYTLHNGCSHCINDHIQRSISQPAVRLPDNDLLLENATFLLDSPVLALRPAHHRSRGTLAVPPPPPQPQPLLQTSLSKPLSTRSSITVNEAITDINESSNSSIISIAAIYRIVFLRSFASMFALAGLFTIEVLQTSIYPHEYSFRSLSTFHLSSSIAALFLAAHVSHIQTTHYRWKISNVFAYDYFSQILIICTTLLTSTWIILQYFYSFYYLLLIGACISGISLSCMITKTYDHLLQLSTSLLMENMKILTIRFNIFMFIYNCICHLALAIGGVCFLTVIIFKQWNHHYILIGSPTCLLMPCVHLIKQQDDNEQFYQPLPKAISIQLSTYFTETKQIWINDSTRFLYLLILVLLTIISLCIQANTKWSTSIMSTNKRLSIIQYVNDDTLNEVSRLTRYKHNLFAIFFGFQEGYLFGSLLKFDITCLYGLRHAVEILIIYGLSATVSSILAALIIRRVTLMTSITFTVLLHSITIVFLVLIRAQISIYNLQPLMLRYILFLSYGIVFGLWSTIIVHSMCHSRKFSSSSAFAQSLAFRYFGRLLAYSCALHLCQTLLFYINAISLFLIFSVLLICYCCCHH